VSAADDHAAKYRNDPHSTDELLTDALTKDADRENEGYWHPIAALQHRLPQIIERIELLGRSDEDKSRDTAATILGQGWVATKFAPDRCAETLLQMLVKEQSTSVLVSIIFALGHLHNPHTPESLIEFSTHPDACIRYAVVSSLCGHDDSDSIEAMIARSSDSDREVRNWATFGLGSQIDTDTPAIREALVARLIEEDDEIRGEAIVGLARRGDIRSAGALLNELNTLGAEVLRDWILITEAAEEIAVHAKASGAKEWCPVLARLAALGIGEQADIQSALERCVS
jgi:hypothetical protein